MKLEGARKVVTCAMGLGSLLALAALATWGHLPTDALGDLTWSVVFLTGTALGANVGEHAFKKPATVAAAAKPSDGGSAGGGGAVDGGSGAGAGGAGGSSA